MLALEPQRDRRRAVAGNPADDLATFRRVLPPVVASRHRPELDMYILTTDSAAVTVDATDEEFDLVLAYGAAYLVCSTVAAWVRPTTPGGTAASAAAGSTVVTPERPLLFRGDGTLTKLSIVRVASDGVATLTRVIA